LTALNTGEGKRIRFGPDQVTYKVFTAETQGRFEFFELAMPTGDAEPEVHIHRNMEEMFYVLEGQAAFVLGDTETTGKPGTFVLIPRGTWHGIANGGSQPCRVLVTFSPGNNMHEYFEQAGRIVGSSQPDAAALRQLSIKYDCPRLNDERLVKNA